MDGLALSITLFVVGFLLLAAEVFLPGLIVGTIGLLCLIASVILVFNDYGASAGVVAGFVVGGLTVAGFLIWLNIFPRTFVGRRIMLFTRQEAGGAAADHQALIGQSGEAITPLRPSGTVRIDGKRVDVTAVGDFIEQGANVVVIAADGMRVAVRQK
jgi:membrane-bound serine protease (ClpP class)